MTEFKKSLAPVINGDASVLILGSMPGEESLRRQQYYGFPGNHFWRLTAAVLEVAPAPQEYSEKLAMLAAGGIGLWDVIESCRRDGSLDTNIREETPNELPELLARYSKAMGGRLRAVFFNGQKAARSFRSSFGLELLTELKLDYHLLPSSSPANTAGFEAKLEQWRIIGDYLGQDKEI